MNWPYFDFKPASETHAHLSAKGAGYLYDEEGHRVVFDGAARTLADWETYLEANDERGSIR